MCFSSSFAAQLGHNQSFMLNVPFEPLPFLSYYYIMCSCLFVWLFRNLIVVVIVVVLVIAVFGHYVASQKCLVNMQNKLLYDSGMNMQKSSRRNTLTTLIHTYTLVYLVV